MSSSQCLYNLGKGGNPSEGPCLPQDTLLSISGFLTSLVADTWVNREDGLAKIKGGCAAFRVQPHRGNKHPVQVTLPVMRCEQS